MAGEAYPSRLLNVVTEGGPFDQLATHTERRNYGGHIMSNITYKDIPIDIQFNEAESRQHVAQDFDVFKREGIDKIILGRFIPWLKGEDFADRDDRKIFDGLHLYEITYNYGRIVAKYSPTGKDQFFGQFEFCFDSASDYTADMLEAVAMEVFVLDGEIVKVSGYDV